MQELCELIHASSMQFNHVNVASAFPRVLQMPPRGVSEDTMAKALRTLEESALQNIHDFGSQGIANTLHIMAKQRHYKPIENLLLALEGRAEVISGEVNSQHVANTLWAFATMGRKPGADDGAAGGAVGGDIRGVQLAGCCKHAVGVCNNGQRAGGADDFIILNLIPLFIP